MAVASLPLARAALTGRSGPLDRNQQRSPSHRRRTRADLGEPDMGLPTGRPYQTTLPTASRRMGPICPANWLGLWRIGSGRVG